jgi:hypothetical protein
MLYCKALEGNVYLYRNHRDSTTAQIHKNIDGYTRQVRWNAIFAGQTIFFNEKSYMSALSLRSFLTVG